MEIICQQTVKNRITETVSLAVKTTALVIAVTIFISVIFKHSAISDAFCYIGSFGFYRAWFFRHPALLLPGSEHLFPSGPAELSFRLRRRAVMEIFSGRPDVMQQPNFWVFSLQKRGLRYYFGGSFVLV